MDLGGSVVLAFAHQYAPVETQVLSAAIGSLCNKISFHLASSLTETFNGILLCNVFLLSNAVLNLVLVKKVISGFVQSINKKMLEELADTFQ